MSGMKWETFIGVDDAQVAGVLTNPYYFGVNSFDLPPAIEFNKADVATGTRSFYRNVPTRKDLAGSLGFEADPETIARLLWWGLGRPVSAAFPVPIGTQTIHTFKPLKAAPILDPFYVREFKAVTGETNGLLYGPAKMNGITLEATAGEKLMASGEFVVSHPAVQAAGVHPAESFPDLETKPFVFDQLVFLDDDHAAFAPATSVAVERMMLNIANNLVTDKRAAQAANSQYPSDLPEGKLEINGEIDLQFDNSDRYDDFMANTEKMMQATFTGPIMTGGTNPYLLQINIPRVSLTEHNRGGAIEGGSDRLVATLGFVALYDATELTELEIILQNLTAAY